MKKYRIGVIGAGAIAQGCHIPGYARAQNCELTAVADPVKRCLDDVAKAGFKFQRQYSNHRDMLKNEQLDVVSICTPNAFHRQIAVDCLKAGCTVLLEKPVAVTLPDAMAIRRALNASGRRLMVGFTHRFNELNQKAREAVRKGLIGKPYMARVRFAHMGPFPGWAKTDWFYNPRLAGGGAMLDMAIHAFDLLQWYIGPITAVQAKVATLRKKIAVDDNNVAILEFGDKCMGYVETGWTSPAGYTGVELMGDNGAIFVDYNLWKATMIRGVRKPSGEATQQTTVLADKTTTDPWSAEMDYFTGNLAGSKPFSVGIDDGISALKVALGAYKSSKTGRRVAIR